MEKNRNRYWNAVQNVPRVGRYLARFIKFLNENGVDMQRLHMVGFSLGAEVAGFAGKTLKELNLRLPRITGMCVYLCTECALCVGLGVLCCYA